MKLAVQYTEKGELLLAELTLDNVVSVGERFLAEVTSQNRLTLRQAALLACSCYDAIAGQYIRLGIFASNNGDTLGELFFYQNAGRCVDKAQDIFARCQPPQTDIEHNVFINLSLDLGFIAVTKGQAADAKIFFKHCVEGRATHPSTESAQSVARNCLESLLVLEVNDAKEQVLRTIKDFFQ
ncbi:MAG TPA: hypothetical protein PLN43_07750 [Anaerolineales bacterium]|nr:hypothetical protein [Anaerolineales bacterium]HNA87676.1 hypothetical protein [Anaerolineales bacterium]HNJ13459.1 hypothetical protein [Anaerolineales bacterium]